MRSGCSLWTSHPLGRTSHCPKINVQMHPSAPILFCQLGPCHRFSGGKNSNIPQNWVISTFSEYSKYHQQTSNPIPFLLHYRKFLSLHKLVSVQWMDGPKKKKSFFIWKIRNRSIDQKNKPVHMSDSKQKHFWRAVRWGRFSPADSARFPGYLHERWNGFERHPQNPVSDRFHISLGEIKNKASRENRGRFWWYWTRKKNVKQYISNNNRRKIDKWLHVKIKKLYSSKDAIMRVKRQGTFTVQMSDKGFTSKMHNELLQVDWKSKKYRQPKRKKWVKKQNKFFIKEDLQMANKQLKR